MKIGKEISERKPPFIVAEISANHNNSLNRTLKLIDAAKNAGADAIKIQTYKPDTITLKSKKKDFLINNKKSLWFGKYLYELYSKGSLPWEWHKAVFEREKKNKITCFSTPFDETAVNFLEKLKCPLYKVASFENNHVPLIEKLISLKKPIIISTGLTRLNDIKFIIQNFKKKKFKNFVLLKCTSSYPAPEEDTNLKCIEDLRKRFKINVGLSDHTEGIGVAIASVMFGSVLIEKHFTLDKKDGGLDDSFSINPKELKELVVETKRAWKSKGKFIMEFQNLKELLLFLKGQSIFQKILKKTNFYKKKYKSYKA